MLNTYYPPFMRIEAKRLTSLGLPPSLMADQLNYIAHTNPSLCWPLARRKVVEGWVRRGKWKRGATDKTSPLNRHLSFVYGTLKRGHGNNRLLQKGGAVFVGRAETARHYVMFDGGFPRVAELAEIKENMAHKAAPIIGEVWLVDDATLAELDRLEGVPHHYRREQTTVLMGGGACLEASIYIIQKPDGRYDKPIKPSGANAKLSWPTADSHW